VRLDVDQVERKSGAAKYERRNRRTRKRKRCPLESLRLRRVMTVVVYVD
jgi:hypothetical protein